MLLLTILSIKAFGPVDASSFVGKDGKTISIPSHWLAEVEFPDKQYSKLLKGNVVKRGNKEVRADCEITSAGDFLCEIEIKNETFRISKIVAKGDLNALLASAKPAQSVRKDKKDEGSL